MDDEDVDPERDAPFAERVRVLRPMLERLRADVICFQEVHGQDVADEPRQLRALKTLLMGYTVSGIFTVLHNSQE